MGWNPVESVMSPMTSGLGLDIFGTEGAQDAALAGQAAGIAAEERMFDKNMEFQTEQWDWQKEQMAPWREIGLENIGRYQSEMDGGFSLSDDAGYQFRLQEGQKGIDRMASSQGRHLSGGTLRELGRYNSGLASQEYAAGYGRWQQRLDRLAQLGTLGYNATTQLGTQGQNYTNASSGLMSNMGASQSQYHQNVGAINAQASVAPWQNLMAVGQVGAGVMTGYGAMTGGG